ncbi:hypothetical protein CPZ29_29070, partial [Klebsiella oxytoca]
FMFLLLRFFSIILLLPSFYISFLLTFFFFLFFYKLFFIYISPSLFLCINLFLRAFLSLFFSSIIR